jgi:hypothetical protein
MSPVQILGIIRMGKLHQMTLSAFHQLERSGGNFLLTGLREKPCKTLISQRQKALKVLALAQPTCLDFSVHLSARNYQNDPGFPRFFFVPRVMAQCGYNFSMHTLDIPFLQLHVQWRTIVRSAFLLTLLGFSVVAFDLARFIHSDQYDAYDFILQGLRVSHPSETTVVDSWGRPKGLVMALSVFTGLFEKVFSRLPAMNDYHVFMALISVAFVLVWVHLISRIWGPMVGQITGIFVMVNELFVHFCFSAMADITTGLYWGLTCSAFIWLCRLSSETSSTRKKIDCVLLLGMLAALSSIGKYHFIVAFPGLLLFYLLLNGITLGKKVFKTATLKELLITVLLPFLVFVITLDLSMRLWSAHMNGLKALLYWVKWFLFRHAFRYQESSTLYVRYLYEMMGPVFTVLSVFSIVFAIRHLPQKLQLFRRSEKLAILSVMGVTFGMLLITQIATHKETRYLLPMLPAIFSLAIVSAHFVYERLPQNLRALWIGLWILAVIHPVQKSVMDWKIYKTEPVYAASEYEGMWALINGEVSPFTKKCQDITAHYASVFPKTRIYPEDLHYQRTNIMTAQIIFHTRISQVLDLHERFAKVSNFPKPGVNFPSHLRDNTCFLLSHTPTGPGAANSLPSTESNMIWIVRVLGTNLSKEKADEYLASTSETSMPQQGKVSCNKDKTLFSCFYAKRFFG